MARTETSSRTLVQGGYNYSLRFVNDANRRVTAVGHASYTTDIISNFTILIYCDLENIPNSSVTTHSLVSNNAATANTNYIFAVNKFTRKINATIIANGGANQTLTSTGTVPYGWGWIGIGCQAGVALKTIIGTSIESTAPTVTPYADATREMSIGSTNANTWIRGNIARIWFFGGAISQAELNDVVYKGLKPASLTQALIWDITEGSGTTLDDVSPNTNTGTLPATGKPDWSTDIPLTPRTTIGTRSIITTNRDTI